jgi:hypothetical protein
MGVFNVPLEIKIQPNDLTCGPTCLHAMYQFWGDKISLDEIIEQIHFLEEGGTYASILGTHALKRNYKAKLYTYNLLVFDPTWFSKDEKNGKRKVNLEQKLIEQLKVKTDPKIHLASKYYLEFLRMGGEILFEDLTKNLISNYLERGLPILTGLSSTYLYQCSRELPNTDFDDLNGGPTGHFVVLSGFDNKKNVVNVADPWEMAHKEFYGGKYYWVNWERLMISILLGVLTFDGNLLILEK